MAIYREKMNPRGLQVTEDIKNLKTIKTELQYFAKIDLLQILWYIYSDRVVTGKEIECGYNKNLQMFINIFLRQRLLIIKHFAYTMKF